MMASASMIDRLKQFWVFKDWAEDELAQVTQLMHPRAFHSHEIVFRQNDRPDYSYLVEEGAIQELGQDNDGKVILRRRAEKGDIVGRYSLMNNTNRRATAIAVEDTKVLAINAADFKALLAAFPRLQDKLRRIHVINRLLATPLFGIFDRERLFHIADLARVVEYPAGQTIYRQSEGSNAFYVIDTGQIKLDVHGSPSGGQTWPKVFTAGSFFGRRDLLQNAPRRATAEALTDTNLFRFNADAFRWLCELEPSFDQALERPDVLKMLKDLPLFSQFNPDDLHTLAGFVGLAHFPAGEVLYRHGEFDPTLYALYDGEAVIRTRVEKGRERPSGYLRPGDAVGQTSLFLQDARDATIEAVVDSNWLYLTRQDLEQFLTENPDARNRLAPKKEITSRQRIKRFPWMDEDEQFVLRERRHWFFLSNWLIPPFLLIFLALVLLVIDLPQFISVGLMIIAGTWVAWRIVDWSNDYFIVTTKRVAHREKILLIRETRDETPLDKIQNMNIAQSFWGNLFSFGTLVIDTAAAAGVTRVTFDFVGDPDGIQRIIFEQVNRRKAGESSETHRAIRGRLEQSIGLSVRPTVPHPAIPQEEDAPMLLPEPSAWARLSDATWGRWFWIARREGGSITWRRHWVRLIRKIWLPGLFLGIMLLALGLVLTMSEAPPLIVVATLFLLLLLASAWFWWNWEDWGNDRYIVTDDRIIDIEALPWGFRSKRTETTFDRIQNVSYEIPHPLATILNYGTVVIFTAGAEGQLDFDYVRDPKAVQAEIFRRLTAFEALQRRSQREQRWQELPQWFAAYQEMQRS